MAELGVQPPTELYAKPPSQQQGGLSGALSDPTRLIDLMGAITRNQMLQNELKSRAAVGQAYQGALNPDGTFDPNKLAAGIRGNPDAAWMLPETTSRMLEQQGTQTDVLQKQDAAARALIGTLPPNATDEELRHYAVTGVRAGIPSAVMVGHVNRLLQLKGRQRADAIAVLQGTALGPSGVAAQQEGPPGPGGETTRRGLGSVLREQAGAGTTTTGLPAYQPQSMAAMNAGNARESEYATDIEPLRQSLDKIADLQKKYGAGFLGPGTKGRQELEATIYSYSPKFAKLLGVDEKKLSDYAELEKYLRSGTLTRASSYGAHSDQQLASAAAATPNVGVTDLAVPELIKVQYALRRAEFAQHQQAAARSGIAGSEYLNEKSQWPSHNDPRAFMIDLMSPDERQKLIASIPKGSPEWQRFNNSLRAGYESGILNRPGRPPAAPPASPAPAATTPATPPPKPGKRSEAVPPATPAKSDRATYPRWEYDQENVPGKQSSAVPPMPGARQAADGHWYVRKPHADGQYQRVIMNA